jgi:hypothetical protein
LRSSNPATTGRPSRTPSYAGQLVGWGESRSGDVAPDPGVLLLGLVAWTRMHGIVSLEIEGFFDQMGLDPARLYKAEIDHLITQRAA